MNVEKIIDLLVDSGLKQEEIADELKVTQASVSRWRMGKSDPKGLNRDNLLRLVKKHGLLKDNVDAPNLSLINDNYITVAVTGNVQAGFRAEPWQWEESEWGEVHVPNRSELKGLSLYAAEISGDSMNKRYEEGSIIVFTNQIETDEDFIPGKRYVFERTRNGETEFTVKKLHRDQEGDYWLLPETDDPFLQEAVAVNQTPENEELRIVGRVVYAITPE